jgi:hypothetical protein
MILTSEQKNQLDKLLDYREEIDNSVFQILKILKEYFPKEYDIAYQHWIPQIVTAIHHNHARWLPRGEHNMQQTINRLLDESKNIKKGVSKYI